MIDLNLYSPRRAVTPHREPLSTQRVEQALAVRLVQEVAHGYVFPGAAYNDFDGVPGVAGRGDGECGVGAGEVPDLARPVDAFFDGQGVAVEAQHMAMVELPADGVQACAQAGDFQAGKRQDHPQPEGGKGAAHQRKPRAEPGQKPFVLLPGRGAVGLGDDQGLRCQFNGDHLRLRLLPGPVP